MIEKFSLYIKVLESKNKELEIQGPFIGPNNLKLIKKQSHIFTINNHDIEIFNFNFNENKEYIIDSKSKNDDILIGLEQNGIELLQGLNRINIYNKCGNCDIIIATNKSEKEEQIKIIIYEKKEMSEKEFNNKLKEVSNKSINNPIIIKDFICENNDLEKSIEKAKIIMEKIKDRIFENHTTIQRNKNKRWKK